MQHHLTTVRRLLEALATGFAVVLELIPDPTRVPVEHDS